MSRQKDSIPALPPGQIYLSDFADMHGVSRNDAYGLWSRGMIGGTKVGQGRKARIAISAAGQHDAYIQFQILPNFFRCDHCPHRAVELTRIEERNTHE
jgi:hypothetical protein